MERLSTQHRAFQAGFSRGINLMVETSPREAEGILRFMGMPHDSEHVDLFCNGCSDGKRGDWSRYVY